MYANGISKSLWYTHDLDVLIQAGSDLGKGISVIISTTRSIEGVVQAGT